MQFSYYTNSAGLACLPGYAISAKGQRYAEYRPGDAAAEVEYEGWLARVRDGRVTEDLRAALGKLSESDLASERLPQRIFEALSRDEEALL